MDNKIHGLMSYFGISLVALITLWQVLLSFNLRVSVSIGWISRPST